MERERTTAVRLNLWTMWLAKHWLAVFNTLVGIFVALPILAPVFMQAGLTRLGGWIYSAYSITCHQSASRSWFLFGEQVAYPSRVAGTSLTPLESYAATLPEFAGVNINSFFEFFPAAQAFVGNMQLGYKMAICERDIAIYAAVFLAGLLFAVIRARRARPLRSLSIIGFVILGILPALFDGGSQMLGYFFSDDLLSVRESTPFLRTLTGAMFGAALVWIAYPSIDESMRDIYATIRNKLQKAGWIG